MDGIERGWILASKDDVAYGVVLFLRMLVGSMPDWLKATLIATVAGLLLWSAVRRLRRRRATVR
ncbi:hypothetical protein [Streptomyces sp. NPDC090022]|uniref:hypothetical protein n=1 Tax=Streptomyces sp. NPDC090022 TaxID=3365920 RepID=UPI003826E802